MRDPVTRFLDNAMPVLTLAAVGWLLGVAIIPCAIDMLRGVLR